MTMTRWTRDLDTRTTIAAGVGSIVCALIGASVFGVDGFLFGGVVGFFAIVGGVQFVSRS
jgi:hypothetical protein